MKKYIKKYTVFIFASFLLGTGLQIMNWADLGVGPMTVMVIGLSKLLKISIGAANLLVSFGQLAVMLVLIRKEITPGTVIAMFTTSLGINVLEKLFHPVFTLPVNYVVLLGGVVVYAFSIALEIFCDCGKSSYDGLIYGFMGVTGKSYHTVRWIVDISFIVIGYFLGGPIGPGTVIVMAVVGIIVEWFLKLLQKTFGIKSL